MISTGKQSAVTGAGPGLLVGRFAHAMDPKRRLTVPSDWRTLMGDPAYVYVFPDPHMKCLNLVPPAEMEGRLDKLRERALFDKTLGPALRVLGENAEQLTLDVQGRIRIRDRLLAFAQLADRVVMIGSMNRIQLWSPAQAPEAEAIDQPSLAEACKVLDF